ncbi:helix-turn-helix domain-containing protein [Paraburkholderia sp. JPY419]|uniref:helix-turn-helix domain-containing protein n=1 Tax=Paraburkholderia sp. JPY419 TaxID=667660 RepID=UPI003D22F1EE
MKKPDPKLERLKRLGVLNPHPERVRAPWFQSGDFFDANDLIQVKYEMLRHAHVDGATKAEAAALFGMSRPTFYQAEAAFFRDGLPGLVPRQRGPKGAHKLSHEVMAFVEQRMEGSGPIYARALAEQLETELGLSVHPRSIERAIARKKNRRTWCRFGRDSAGASRRVRGDTRVCNGRHTTPGRCFGTALSRSATRPASAC